MTDEEFDKKVLAYDCPHCHAEVGNPCVDLRGYKTKTHSRRADKLRTALWEWERKKYTDCPTCGGKGRIKIIGDDK